MGSKVIRWLLSSVFFFVAAQYQAWGCQYTVRDIGFVDLRGPEYTLVVSCPESLQNQLGDWEYLDDCNIRILFELTGDQLPEGIRSPECKVELVDFAGRRLLVGEYQSDFQSVSKRVFDRLFGSQTFTKLRERSIDSFAQIIVFELGDPQSIEQANMAIDEAVKAIKRIEPMLPRPLARPIEVMRISAETIKEEPLLAWCLMPDASTKQGPMVAVIYGRTKLAGKTLRENRITSRELLSQLALVGESCECETDRSWNEELVLPGFWPAEFRRKASSSLGFDPDSPLVQAEISRIVERGPKGAKDPSSRNGDGVDDIEQLLLGYDERTVAVRGDALENGDAISHANTDQVSSDVAVVLHSGDGWDFSEPDAAVAEAANVVPATSSKTPVSSSLKEQASDSMAADVTVGTSRLFPLFYVLGGLAGTLLLLGFVIQWLMRT